VGVEIDRRTETLRIFFKGEVRPTNSGDRLKGTNFIAQHAGLKNVSLSISQLMPQLIQDYQTQTSTILTYLYRLLYGQVL
jgi:hypothetical protein